MLTALVLGLAQGVRHSLEPDHLAAVSALIGELRSVKRSAWLGALWGLGHSVSIAAVAVAVVAFGATLQPAAERLFTIAVGALLVALGVRALRHTQHRVTRSIRTPMQAFAVGTVHGLAGSSAVVALVVAALPSAASQLVYVGLFGTGSVLGMAAVSAVAGLGLRRVHGPRGLLVLRLVTGLLSIALGMMTVIAAW